jgi:hypothetical protein
MRQIKKGNEKLYFMPPERKGRHKLLKKEVE